MYEQRDTFLEAISDHFVYDSYKIWDNEVSTYLFSADELIEVGQEIVYKVSSLD